MNKWSLQLNAGLGSIIATCGLWLVWSDAPVAALGAAALILAMFLAWGSGSLATVWAWTTGLLGLESLAWPIVTMVQIKSATSEPTEQEMGAILIAMLFGLFSSIFWLTFSYGIFKRFVNVSPESSPFTAAPRSGSRRR